MGESTLTSAETKRRGLAAIEEGLRRGPVRILKRNRLAPVIVSGDGYQRLAIGVEIDRRVIDLATAIRARHRTRTPDAIQAACCPQIGAAHRMLGGDRALRRIEGLEVVVARGASIRQQLAGIEDAVGVEIAADRAHQRECRRVDRARHEVALGKADAVLARERAAEREDQVEDARAGAAPRTPGAGRPGRPSG